MLCTRSALLRCAACRAVPDRASKPGTVQVISTSASVPRPGPQPGTVNQNGKTNGGLGKKI